LIFLAHADPAPQSAHQVPAWSRHFGLVRYDRRGYGQSSVPKGPYPMERLGRDVLAVIDALGIGK